MLRLLTASLLLSSSVFFFVLVATQFSLNFLNEVVYLSSARLASLSAPKATRQPAALSATQLSINKHPEAIDFTTIGSGKRVVGVSLAVEGDECVATGLPILVSDEADSVNGTEDLEFFAETLLTCCVGKSCDKDGLVGVGVGNFVVVKGLPYDVCELWMSTYSGNSTSGFGFVEGEPSLTCHLHYFFSFSFSSKLLLIFCF